MKKTLTGLMICVLCLPAGHAGETTPSIREWTPAAWYETMRLKPAGDATRGARLAKVGYCYTCHGDQGVAPSRNAPSLAAQNETYLYKTLLDFRSRLWWADHKDDGMHALARTFTKQDLADLAAYYATRKLPTIRKVKKGDVHTEKLVRFGDPSRLVTSCAACHGAHGEGGVNEVPRIEGQSYLYLKRQLTLFKEGRRHNDVGAGMRFVTEALSEDELDRLARYYANGQK
ncbi:c-type cytochrome [Sulfurivirga sp.]|uniref:c-type cytochrome n=1 Tax=Sulfurivirga sp. TaxID=2614236 RepID=UPI0025F02D9E|nr:c-type cytochrome [Sulfurivirga sp.]